MNAYKLVARLQDALPALVYFCGEHHGRINIEINFSESPLQMNLWYPIPTGEVGWIKLERNIIKVASAMLAHQ